MQGPPKHFNAIKNGSYHPDPVEEMAVPPPNLNENPVFRKGHHDGHHSSRDNQTSDT
jgi:hypothetical protein